MPVWCRPCNLCKKSDGLRRIRQRVHHVVIGKGLVRNIGLILGSASHHFLLLLILFIGDFATGKSPVQDVHRIISLMSCLFFPKSLSYDNIGDCYDNQDGYDRTDDQCGFETIIPHLPQSFQLNSHELISSYFYYKVNHRKKCEHSVYLKENQAEFMISVT